MNNQHPTLITTTPTKDHDLAMKLARMTIKMTQADATVRDRLRPNHAENADLLIAVSAVMALHFATAAAANKCWTDGR